MTMKLLVNNYNLQVFTTIYKYFYNNSQNSYPCII